MAVFMDRKSVFMYKEKENEFACSIGEHHEECSVEVKYHIFLCFEMGDGWLCLQALVFFRGRRLLCGKRVRNA
jgi:hypothetical protein